MSTFIPPETVIGSFLFLSPSLFLFGCGSSPRSSSGGAGEKVPVILRFRLPGAAKARLKTIAAPSVVVPQFK